MKIPFLSRLGSLFSGERPPFEGFYFLIFLMVLSYMVGDLAALYSRKFLLPKTAPQKLVQKNNANNKQYKYYYVAEKNIFNSDHKMATPLGGSDEEDDSPQDGKPVKSSLALTLVGTIVHANEERSVATVMAKGKSRVKAYQKEDLIENLATLISVERGKIIIRNKRTKRLEYIEIPKNEKLVIAKSKPKRNKTMNTTPSRPVGQTSFTFDRSEIDKKLENLPALLQQARAVPDVGPDGRVKCYRLVSVARGSFYEKLGVRANDCILRVNSEDVTSPQKAMEMYQALKTESKIVLTVDRDGSEVDLDFTIN